MSFGAWLLAIAAATVPVVTVTGQTRVLVVDDGPDSADFATIQAAVDAAGDGDVVLVRPGRYPSFAVRDKALVVTAERPGTVDVIGGPFFGPALEVSGLAASRSVVVRGLDLQAGGTFAHPYAVWVRSNAGSVWFEECGMRRWSGEHALRIEACAEVLLARCTVPTGAWTTGSSVHLLDCIVEGVDGTPALQVLPGSYTPATPGSDALTVEGGFVFAAGSTIRGGDGGDDTTSSPQCLAAHGGDGILLRSGSPLLRTLDCTLAGGAAGAPGGSCALPGVPVRVVSGTNAPMAGSFRRMRSNAVIQEGSAVRWSITGSPGDRAFVAIGLGPAPAFHLGFRGTAALRAPVIVPLGVVPASGRLDLTLTMPALGATQGVTLYAQGVFTDVAAQGWLSSPTQLTGLDLVSVGTLGRDCNGNMLNDTYELMAGVPDVDRDHVLDVCQSFTVVHVDDDAPNDPGPGNPLVSDPLENGSAAHPFDALQEAIDAAPSSPYPIVLVEPGVYRGAGNVGVDFRGKALTVRGSIGAAQTVIDCQGAGPAFTFGSGEGQTSRLEDVRIVRGRTSGSGGAVVVLSADPVIAGCEFADNAAVGLGGAIWARNSALNVLRCTFDDNMAASGGAVAIVDDGVIIGATFRRHPELHQCRFYGNGASSSGGAVAIDTFSTTARVGRCWFERNTAAGRGGAITVSGRLAVTSSLLVRNIAGDSGGGMAVAYGSDAAVHGSTIAHNAAQQAGGGIVAQTSRLSLRDSIVWGNGAARGLQIDLYFGTADVSFSDVEGGLAAVTQLQSAVSWGPGNLAVDPMFVDPSTGVYVPATGSPCIDAGDPAYQPLILEKDRLGVPRVLGTAIDMGAFEG